VEFNFFIRCGFSRYKKYGISLPNCNIPKSTDFLVCIEEEDTDFGQNPYELIMRRNGQRNYDVHTRFSEFRSSAFNVSKKSAVANSNSPTVFSDKPTSSTSDTTRASLSNPFRPANLSPLPSNSETILNSDEHYSAVLNNP
jgi:hypothetical protein